MDSVDLDSGFSETLRYTISSQPPSKFVWAPMLHPSKEPPRETLEAPLSHDSAISEQT